MLIGLVLGAVRLNPVHQRLNGGVVVQFRFRHTHRDLERIVAKSVDYAGQKLGHFDLLLLIICHGRVAAHPIPVLELPFLESVRASGVHRQPCSSLGQCVL